LSPCGLDTGTLDVSGASDPRTQHGVEEGVSQAVGQPVLGDEAVHPRPQHRRLLEAPGQGLGLHVMGAHGELHPQVRVPVGVVEGRPHPATHHGEHGLCASLLADGLGDLMVLEVELGVR